MTLEWKEEYALGHPEIDAQHKHLFALIGQMADVQTPDQVKPTLMQLYKHTREHFELEEGLMRQAGYPGLAVHAGYHNGLLTRLNTLSEDVGKGHLDHAALDKLMVDWALRHTQFDDADAAGYIAKLDTPAHSPR